LAVSPQSLEGWEGALAEGKQWLMEERRQKGEIRWQEKDEGKFWDGVCYMSSLKAEEAFTSNHSLQSSTLVS
jgi:hypothetical protein